MSADPPRTGTEPDVHPCDKCGTPLYVATRCADCRVPKPAAPAPLPADAPAGTDALVDALNCEASISHDPEDAQLLGAAADRIAELVAERNEALLQEKQQHNNAASIALKLVQAETECANRTREWAIDTARAEAAEAENARLTWRLEAETKVSIGWRDLNDQGLRDLAETEARLRLADEENARLVRIINAMESTYRSGK